MAGIKQSLLQTGKQIRFLEGGFKTIADNTRIAHPTLNAWGIGSELVIGSGADKSMCLGTFSRVENDSCTAVGYACINTGSRTVNIGFDNVTNSDGGVHIGNNQLFNAGVPGGVIIGKGASANTHTATAICRDSFAGGFNAHAFGINSTATSNDVALGPQARSLNDQCCAVGLGAQAGGGLHSAISRRGSISIGVQVDTFRPLCIALGNAIRCDTSGTEGCIAIGHGKASNPAERLINSTSDSFMVGWIKNATTSFDGQNPEVSVSDRPTFHFDRSTFWKLYQQPSLLLNGFKNSHTMELLATYNYKGVFDNLAPAGTTGSSDLTCNWQHKIISVSANPSHNLVYNLGGEDIISIYRMAGTNSGVQIGGTHTVSPDLKFSVISDTGASFLYNKEGKMVLNAPFNAGGGTILTIGSMTSSAIRFNTSASNLQQIHFYGNDGQIFMECGQLTGYDTFTGVGSRLEIKAGSGAPTIQIYAKDLLGSNVNTVIGSSHNGVSLVGGFNLDPNGRCHIFYTRNAANSALLERFGIRSHSNRTDAYFNNLNGLKLSPTTTSLPNSTSCFDMSEFNDKGILIPRLTTIQRDAVITPSLSLLIFNITSNRFEYHNGTAWVGISSVV